MNTRFSFDRARPAGFSPRQKPWVDPVGKFEGCRAATSAAPLVIACMVFIAAGLGAVPSAWSATLTWDSTATGTNWSAASNWGGTLPGVADVGVFAAGSYTAQPSLTSTAAIGGIWDMGTGAITISGTTLSIAAATINSNLGTGIELDSGAGPLSINAPLVLTSAQTWINNSVSPITVNGNMAAGSLTETGSGLVVLSGSNTFGGNLTINGGTLQTPGGTNSGISNLYVARLSGSSGAFSLGGGSLAVGSEYVGFSGTGAFTQSGGTQAIGSFLTLAQNSGGGSGSYTLTGGSLFSGNSENIGEGGTASFNQSGGTNSTASVYFGRLAGASGTYSLSSSGLFSAQSVSVGYSGTGAFGQSGGTSIVPNLIVGDQSGGVGSYILGGSGLLSSGTETIGNSGSGAFTQTGGTNTISSALYLGFSTGSSGAYNLQGGLLVVPEIVQGAGSSALNVTGGSLVTNGANLTISTSGGLLTLGGQIGGSGGLIKTGGGTLALGGNNTYSGSTSVTQGAIVLANSGAAQNSTVYVNVNNGLQFAPAIGAFDVGAIGGTGNLLLADTGGNPITLVSGGNNASTTYGGVISGPGVLVKNGSGTQALTGSNTYSGGTVLGPDDLVAGNSSALGSGALSIEGSATWRAGASFAFSNSIVLYPNVTGTFNTQGFTTTINGVISGPGNLNKTGSGTLILANANTFTGITSISQGTLELANGSALQNSTVNINVNNGLQISPAVAFVSGLSGNASLTLSGSLEVGGDDQSSTYGGSIGGGGPLVKAGSGTFELTGSNTWTGGTVLDPGILAINGDAALGAPTGSTTWGGLTANVIFANNSTLQARGSITLAASRSIAIGAGVTATFDTNGNAFEIDGIVSGPGALAVAGGGTLVLTNTETFTGGATIGAATLQVGNGGAMGWLNGNIVDNGLLVFARSDSPTFSGAISGSGNVQQAGSGALLLNGSNSFTGNMILKAGVLDLASPTALQSTILVLSGGSLNLNGISASLGGLAGTGSLAWGAGTLTVGSGANSTYSGSLSGAGGLIKIGSGTLAFTNSNAYSGGTTLEQGALSINSDAALGAVPMSPSTNITFAADSTLQAGGSFALATNRNIAIAASTTGTFNASGNTLTIGSLISGPGALAVTGGGTLVLTQSEAFSGGTTINGATLLLGSGGSTGWVGGNIIDNGLLVFSRSDSPTFSGAISGSGSIEQAGPGTLLFGGTNTFTGKAILSAGILELGNATALQYCTVLSSGGTLNLNNLSATLGALGGSGNLPLSNGTLTLGGNGSSTVFEGTLSGGANLTKTGSGLFVLAGSNAYTGLTTIGEGVLEASTTGSIPGLLSSTSNPVRVAGDLLAVGVGGSQQWSVANITALLAIPSLFGSGGTIGIDTSGGDFTESNLTGGSLGVVKLGPNTLTLTGTNSFPGGMLVSSGALELTATDALAGLFTPGSVTVSSGATLALPVGGSQQWTTANINRLLAVNGMFSPGAGLGFDTNYGSFSLSPTGNSSAGLTVIGSNSLTLSGSNCFSGVTNISQGTLQLASSAALLESTVAIDADNGLQFGPGIGTFYLGGLSGGNLLQLSDTTGNAVALVVGRNGASTTFSGELDGNGAMTKTGTGILVLSGSNDYSGETTVDDGTLSLTNPNALPYGASLIVGADAQSIFGLSPIPVPNASSAVSSGSAVTAVPEPGTQALLLAVFAIGCGVWQKKKGMT